MAPRVVPHALVALALFGCSEAPQGGAVNIAPLHPITTDDLLARLGEDASGRVKDPVAYRWSWSVDGSPVADLDGQTVVPADRTAKGQAWEVTVVPSGGGLDGAPFSAKVVVGNARPVITDVRIGPEDAYVGTEFTATATAEDPDGDSVSFRFAWFVDGVKLAEGQNPTFRTELATRRRQVGVQVVADDGESESEPASSGFVGVQNRVPEVGWVEIAPDGPTVLSTMTCRAHDVADPDEDRVRLRYAWEVDGAVVEGATTSRLELRPFVRGQDVACTVTPNDGIEDGETVRSVDITIVNIPPTEPAVALDPTDVCEDLFCELVTPATDADGDVLTYTVSWFRNGEPWTGPTSTTIHPGDTILGESTVSGDTWRCATEVSDGEATAASRVSNEIQVPTTEPEVYYVMLADLVNQPSTCDSFGGIHRYSSSGTSYGFKWRDRQPYRPSSITVAYNHALNCSVGARTGFINDVAVGTVYTGDLSNCICNVTAGMWAKEYTFTDIDSYKPGVENTFTMSRVTSEGMSPRPEWGNYYGIVTVRYCE